MDMPQYMVIGKDGYDAEAPERRANARPMHLEGAKALKASGNLITACALLNDEGSMTGSVMIMEFENDAALQTYLEAEPYIKQLVWQDVEVKPIKVANL
jgi:uncharacterized protein YciI